MSKCKTVQDAVRFESDRERKLNKPLLTLPLMALVVAGAGTASAQTSVTTWHNDIGRTGQNLNETVLTTSNVNATQFGKLFSQTVDAQVYAQPLYLPNVTIAGQQHNVVFVATENDTVYAFDADNNGGSNASPLWQASMLTAAHGAASGATAVPASELSSDITPLVGITGTPVIDPSTNTLYVVSKSLEGGNAVQRLHALDVTTGNEKFSGPVVITATVAGTGNGSSGGQLAFDPMWENQRPGLLLLNGIVYIAFGSHGDNGPWHGWILGYNAATLKQTGAYNATPNGVGAGFWMSGAGLAADQLNPSTQPYGRLFAATGNGDYTGATPYTNSLDYGDSILNLNLANGAPTMQDEFTPSDQANMDGEDGDLGSGGTMVIPTQTTGSYPHLLVQVGKEGTLYLINRDSMGGYNSVDSVVQEIEWGVGQVGAWSSAAYWNGNVYYWGRADNLKCFPLVNGQLSTNPTESSETYGFPGATPSISANGTTQGIVWSIDSEAYTSSGSAVLQAHNASNCATTLYSSATNSSRDNPGGAVKFTVPTIANGKVYVGAMGQISVYGLLGATQQAATPVINPGSETFTASVSVTITDSTPGATIYYTTNGSTPTTSSTVYSGPITVSATETINAIANASGYLASQMATATYTDITQASPPTFSVGAGTYTSTQSVTLSDTTPGAAIYYTTDGSTPTTSSSLYTTGSSITVASTETINAIAVASGYLNSAVASATYTIVAPINFPDGFSNSQGQIILNGSSQLDDSRLQLTDGGYSESGSAWFVTPVNIQSFTTNFTFQLSNPVADGITFTIQGQGISALGANSSGLGYQNIPNSVVVKFDLYNDAGEGINSTGFYVNGANPTVPSIDLSSTGIDLHSDDTMDVSLVYDGTTLAMTITDNVTMASYSTSIPINIPATVGGNTAYVGFTGSTNSSNSSSQKLLTWSFTPGSVVSLPVFQPVGGIYQAAQSVTISDSTPNAAIYYTTNGTIPTTSSTHYTGTAIPMSSNETIEAIAVASGFANSAVASSSYTISSTVPAPTFSLPSGTYGTSVITIADSAPGATVYYTTDGTTPTTSSTKYTGAITLNTAGTITLKAIAVLSGFANSPVATAIYTIQLPLTAPVFSPASGSYTTAQSVTISASAGATIYYTTNGTAPTTSSAVYSGPITVSSSETLEAIAAETGYANSAVATATYTITPTLSAPTFSVAAGTYTSAQTVSISDATAGTTIYYTTNGTTPTTSSTKYTGAITVSSTETVEAMAVETGYTNSAVAIAAYTISSGSGTSTSVFNISNFASVATQLAFNGNTKLDGAKLQLTDGGLSENSSAWYSTPVSVNSFTTNFTFQETNAVADGFTFTIQGVGTNALGTGGAGLGYTNLSQSVGLKFYLRSIGTIPQSTGLYTNGAAVYTSTGSVNLAPVNLTSGDVMNVQLVYNGTTLTMTLTDTVTNQVFTTSFSVNIPATVGGNTAYVGFTAASGGYGADQEILSWSYSTTPVLPTPAFSVAAGTYTTAQTVSISDATAGTTIYYTTNGTTPTTSSTKYTGAVTVSSTETLEAVAVETGYTSSAVATATYTIAAALPAPTFSVPAGIYTTAQTVSISDATAGTTIYYTTNGTTPTTSSTKYTGAITVSSTETLEAIAVETGYTNSAVTTATYTISSVLPAPTFSVAAGTYTTAQTVSISDATAGTTIYYTTNGTTPTTLSTKYTGAITVSSSETLEAIAVETGYTNSAVATAAYTISSGSSGSTPVFSITNFANVSSQLSFNGNTKLDGAKLQLTDGGLSEDSSAWYSTPVNVSSFTTNFTFQETKAVADGFMFTIQNYSAKALGTGGAGLGFDNLPLSVGIKFYLDGIGTMPESTGLYTDGAMPFLTTGSINLATSGINLASGDVMAVQLVYNGTTLSMTLTDTVTSKVFTQSFTVNIPSTVGASTAYVGFTGASGGAGADQEILTWSYSN